MDSFEITFIGAWDDSTSDVKFSATCNALDEQSVMAYAEALMFGLRSTSDLICWSYNIEPQSNANTELVCDCLPGHCYCNRRLRSS